MFEELLQTFVIHLSFGQNDSSDASLVGEVEVGSLLDQKVGDIMVLIVDASHEGGPSH